jgi:hypothetical protein
MSLVSVVCCQVDVAATGRSFFQRSFSERICVNARYCEEDLAHKGMLHHRKKIKNPPVEGTHYLNEQIGKIKDFEYIQMYVYLV